MDTKEAIEFFKKARGSYIYIRELDDKLFDEIIDLLEQGEKYRLMVEEIEKNVLNMNGEDFRGMVEMIKDKYFPKDLLQQGKKYKIIIEELKKEYGNGILENDYGIGVQLFNLIEILEQKYFPKETNQDKEGNE